MTTAEKILIQNMLDGGSKQAEIAKAMNLNPSTLKTFLFRNTGCRICLNCGSAVPQKPKAKTRKFCSDRCRLAWWKAHPDQAAHRINIQVVCPSCGKPFISHRNRPRKFCCRACYEINIGGKSNDERQ